MYDLLAPNALHQQIIADLHVNGHNTVTAVHQIAHCFKPMVEHIGSGEPPPYFGGA